MSIVHLCNIYIRKNFPLWLDGAMCISIYNHFHHLFTSKSQRREVIIKEAFNARQGNESMVLSQKPKPL